EFVIRAHDTACPSIDTIFEMWQIDFAQGTLIAGDIDLETCVLLVVERVVFHAGNHIVLLHTLHKCGPHVSHMERVFSIRLLPPTTSRVAQQIDTDPPKEITTQGANLLANGFAHPAFEVNIEASPPLHGYRETGAMTRNDPTRTITEHQRGNAEPFISACRIR